MPTIKLTTGGSAVILKGGKPSCTCCDEVCSPEVTTLYVEHIGLPYGSATITYFEMTGSLNAGSFTGTGPNGTCNLIWDGAFWEFHDLAFDPLYGDSFPPDRCLPNDVYPPPVSPPWDYSVTVSFTPLP